MNLKTAIITIFASVVMGGTQYSNPDENATHRKCSKGRKLQQPRKIEDYHYEQLAPTEKTEATKPPQSPPPEKEANPLPVIEYTRKPKKDDANKLECLNRHNEYRRKLRTQEGPLQELKWSDKLAKKAQEWANQLVKDNSDGGISLRHSTDWDYGENLYSSWNKDQSCTAATDAWWAERPLYHNEPIGEGNFGDYGHYTQLVWPTTAYVGCACANNGPTKRFWVCEYDPPGNMLGERLLYEKPCKKRHFDFKSIPFSFFHLDI
jgi:uncharacterized protein YkwD